MASSAEAFVAAALAGIGVKAYPDVAPSGAPRPYVTFQAVGGQDVNDMGGPADLENQRMQISAWSETRLATAATMRSARDALVAAGALPIGSPVSDHEQDTQLYGSRLDFSVWFRP
ncbi:DUF3168 domain-containing protein [Cupriavidus taiwanensis]|uniref:DUF3168 domain-containing protein n=1 Tax=Cupriavidus taiwanensis TaxID=164546 RepID=A0A375IY72_9BURK|nr:DUF3168 domain-containing protein [Cupriavidus taiwanensis]SPR97352.1 conserved hypothetical protein [Cupriavidus taiwanensis]